MTEAANALIAEATRALRIRDVMLNECRFKRPTDPPAPGDAVEVRQLTKRTVGYKVGEVPAEAGKALKLLQVVVALGIRIISKDGEPDKAPIYFEIEADFLVEYEMTKDLRESAIRVFAETNSVHNAWPFWRQHVFDTISRGRLPHIDVPLYSTLVKKRKRPKRGVKRAAA